MNTIPPKLLPGYTRVYADERGGCVDVHELHGKQERLQNLAIAQWLATWGEHVCLLPINDAPGMKSPDATRNGVVWEFKVPVGLTINAIDKALRDGSKQAPNILIQVSLDFDSASIEKALFDRVKRTADIRAIAILRGSSLVHFNRREVVENTFRGKMG